MVTSSPSSSPGIVNINPGDFVGVGIVLLVVVSKSNDGALLSNVGSNMGSNGSVESDGS